jgi:hypothetical protein
MRMKTSPLPVEFYAERKGYERDLQRARDSAAWWKEYVKGEAMDKVPEAKRWWETPEGAALTDEAFRRALRESSEPVAPGRLVLTFDDWYEEYGRLLMWFSASVSKRAQNPQDEALSELVQRDFDALLDHARKRIHGMDR